MSLSTRRKREQRRREFIENLRRGSLAGLGERGPYYPIALGYRFRPDFLPLDRTRYEKSFVGGQDLRDGLPPHQFT